MRILTQAFIERFHERIMNIHPSLLPAFPGVDTHRRALEEGVRLHGCTVHFVTPDRGHGPIIVQAAVPVLPDDDEARLAARVLEQEHKVYPAGDPLVPRRPAGNRERPRDDFAAIAAIPVAFVAPEPA